MLLYVERYIVHSLYFPITFHIICHELLAPDYYWFLR